MILTAFFKALGQIGDSRFRRVLFLGVLLTILLLIVATTGLVWFVNWITGDVAFLNNMTWLQDVLSWGSVLIMLILSVFLMVPVASAITSMFLDDVAKAVEDKHYPHLPPVDPVPFLEQLRDTVNFLGVVIAANIAALLLFLVFNVAWIFVFWALNGFLLGREYFTMSAMRRVGRVEARRLRSKHSVTIWIAGVLMAMPLSVPLLNLFIPILGAATFTHLFHMLTKDGSR